MDMVDMGGERIDVTAFRNAGPSASLNIVDRQARRPQATSWESPDRKAQRADTEAVVFQRVASQNHFHFPTATGQCSGSCF